MYRYRDQHSGSDLPDPPAVMPVKLLCIYTPIFPAAAIFKSGNRLLHHPIIKQQCISLPERIFSSLTVIAKLIFLCQWFAAPATFRLPDIFDMRSTCFTDSISANSKCLVTHRASGRIKIVQQPVTKASPHLKPPIPVSADKGWNISFFH